MTRGGHNDKIYCNRKVRSFLNETRLGGSIFDKLKLFEIIL